MERLQKKRWMLMKMSLRDFETTLVAICKPEYPRLSIRSLCGHSMQRDCPEKHLCDTHLIDHGTAIPHPLDAKSNSNYD